MKKAKFIIFLVLGMAIKGYAQTIPKSDSLNFQNVAAPWCFDFNIRGGLMSQTISAINLTNGYSNPLTANAGTPKFSNGAAYGFDGQVGYFFDKKGHYGVGLGVMCMLQSSKLQLSNLDVAYQSWDASGNTFRQIVSTSHSVQETILTTNVSIPLVFKYKTKLQDRLGFSLDAGLLYNVVLQNRYNTNAAFDYEAIYQYSSQSAQFVYDNTLPYSVGDILYTKAGSKSTNVGQWFDQLRSQGYNVGIAQRPTSTTGHVTFKAGTLGFIFQPSLTWYLSENVTLNAGPFLTWQSTNNATPVQYRITDKVGQYSSLLNTASQYTDLIYGLNVGVRYTFGKQKDHDHDGIPDKVDRCPNEFGTEQFNGCPDSDMDGIPDPEDSCPHQHGLLLFHGCPDTDGDGVMDKNDACPNEPGLAIFNGCPDTDGDGIPDRTDSCPRQPGLAQFSGCPDSDGDGIPDNLDACPFLPGNANNHGCPDSVAVTPEMERGGRLQIGGNGGNRGGQSVPEVKNRNIHTSVITELDRKQIHFDFNKATLNKSSHKYLQSIAQTMKENPETILTIDGFSDNQGPAAANIAMSKKRAESVKAYMMKQGIPADRLRARGHGKRMPVGNNHTRTGRAKNRRALMVVKSTNRRLKDNYVSNTSAISVYPNEEKGSFTILLKTNFEENAEVTITNAKGKVVKQFQIAANKPVEFAMDEPGGLYSFTAATKTTKYEARIIISE